jgi:hypothetical protein
MRIYNTGVHTVDTPLPRLLYEVFFMYWSIPLSTLQFPVDAGGGGQCGKKTLLHLNYTVPMLL